MTETDEKEMKIRFKLITLIIFYATVAVDASPPKFHSINSMFGISMRVTNSICMDNNGFIWASSRTGILRLTEDDYRIYQLPYESAGAIIVKLIYVHSELIAYTNNGQIFSYNSIYDRFDLLVDISKTLNNKRLYFYSLLIDDSGDFWMALNIGFYHSPKNNLSIINEVSKERYSLAWFDKQHLIMTKADGIWLFNIQTQKSKCIYQNKNLTLFYVSRMLYDKNQSTLWMGTASNGIYSYNFNSDTFSHILESSFPRQPILAIEENTDSTLLVGVDGQGVWELNKRDKRVLNIYKESPDDPYSLRGNGVYDIFCDPNKRVWICTISGGVSFFDQAPQHVNQIAHIINNNNSLVNNDVNCIVEDHSGKLWFATNNGISCWDLASNQWKNFNSNQLEHAQVFLSLCEDNKGRIWAGSYSSGIYILDGKTGKELAHYLRDEKGSPPVSNFVFDIFKDSQNDIWIGGSNGEFICYQSNLNKFRTYSVEPVSSFVELSPGRILVGLSYGLSLLDKQSGKIENLLMNIAVQDILLIGEEVWICTSGEGLVRYNYKTKTSEKFTTQAGLPSNFLNSILYSDDYLWIGTEIGICRFNPINKEVLTFSSTFPLSSYSYNKHSRIKLQNGQLVWGSNNGVVIFDPNSISESRHYGKIYFQDLTISGRSIRKLPAFKLNAPVDSIQSIKLKYPQNDLSLELIPTNVPSGSKFSWKLEGFDRNWTNPTDNRILTYTNIPSGKFKLRMKLYNSSLSQDLTERSLRIEIVPPFWRKAWFIIVLSLFISGIVFLFLLYYINSLKQKHTSEKVRFFTNTAHEIRTSLTLIKAPVEELIHEKNLSELSRYYLKIAIEQARRLTTVVTQLMDFQKMDIGKDVLTLSMVDIVNLISIRKLMYESFARSRTIDIEFITDRPSYFTAVDETKMEKVIDNLISNAVKYSNPRGKILIELKCENDKWLLKVIDKGIGISKKAQGKLFKEFYRGENAINLKVIGSGIGLLLVKNYVTMHGGSISCESQENSGSTFFVTIPFKKIAEKVKPIVSYTPEAESHFERSINTASIEPVLGLNLSKTMNILVIEDNEELRNFIANTLSGEFKIFVAEDGAEAWGIISNQFPDLIVSDVMMPNMDGFELCRLVKSTYETSHIPIILLTALSEKTEQLHGLGLGADDYLTKPFDVNVLTQKIKSIIHNREVVRDKALNLIKEGPFKPILINKLNDNFLKKMLEVVRVNISNAEFNKDEFASAMNVSSSLLYKKIKSLTNQSPTDFIKTYRLNYASELLHTRKYTVTEVSELCGFGSVGYFSTVFKKFFGKSPTDILV